MHFLALWAPVALWMGVTFYASSRSDVGALGRVPDILTHGAEFFVLGALLARAWSGGFGAPLGLAGALATTLLATAWGVLDEYHQAFVPGRDASRADVAKDLGGALLAVAVHRWRTREGER